MATAVVAGDGSGLYQFTGLAPGHSTDAYQVRVVLSSAAVSAGYVFTTASTAPLGSDVTDGGAGTTRVFQLVDFEGDVASTTPSGAGDAGLVTPKATIVGQDVD